MVHKVFFWGGGEYPIFVFRLDQHPPPPIDFLRCGYERFRGVPQGRPTSCWRCGPSGGARGSPRCTTTRAFARQHQFPPCPDTPPLPSGGGDRSARPRPLPPGAGVPQARPVRPGEPARRFRGQPPPLWRRCGGCRQSGVLQVVGRVRRCVGRRGIINSPIKGPP